MVKKINDFSKEELIVFKKIYLSNPWVLNMDDFEIDSFIENKLNFTPNFSPLYYFIFAFFTIKSIAFSVFMLSAKYDFNCSFSNNSFSVPL